MAVFRELAHGSNVFNCSSVGFSPSISLYKTNGFLEQILDVIHTADISGLQQFTDFCSALVFFGTAILSSHSKNLRCGASILHHIEGLHKTWDCPPSPNSMPQNSKKAWLPITSATVAMPERLYKF